MKKTITFFVLLFFFFTVLPLLADGEIEGDIGLDWVLWGDDEDPDIDSTVGGGGDSNNGGVVNEQLVGRATSGSEVIADMKNNPTGLKKMQTAFNSLAVYKLNAQAYVLQCLESDTKGLNYSILSVLGTKLLSNRNLQGTSTVLETQGLPSGTYLVLVHKGTQLQKVFKIIL